MPFFSWPSSLAYSSFPVFMPGGNGGAGIKGVSHNAQEGRFYPLRSAGLLVLLPVRFPGGGAVHFGVAGSAAVAAAFVAAEPAAVGKRRSTPPVRFKEGRFVEGLTEGIGLAGEALATYFPCQRDDTDELSNEISLN